MTRKSSDRGGTSTLIFKALHILLMFSAVTILAGGELLWGLAIWRRDVALLVAIRRMLVPGAAVVGIAFLLAGVAFGLLTAATGGFNFFAGWLIVAYVLVVALFVNAGALGRSELQLADAAAEAEAGQRPREEVVAQMTVRRALLAAINVPLYAALILDMVLKPF